MLRRYPNDACCKGSFGDESRFKGLPAIASYPALALAFGFFVVTCFVLFKDVWDGAAITTDHVMSFAVLVGTFASGHLLWGQLQEWRLLPALGLLVLFAAGTFYCVTSAGGRNAATTGAKADLVHQSNEDRARIEGDLKEARNRLREAQEAEEGECGTGVGVKCQGRRSTRQERETYARVLEAQLRLMDPSQSEYPELKHASRVFASLGIGNNDQAIFEKLVLWFPFLKALFAEIATLVFGSVGIRHRKVSRETISWKLLETVPRRKPRETSLGFLSVSTKPLTKTEALAHLLSLVDGNSSLPSQSELQKRFGVGSKGTVSKWLSEWEAQGQIRRSQDGRCKQISVCVGPVVQS